MMKWWASIRSAEVLHKATLQRGSTVDFCDEIWFGDPLIFVSEQKMGDRFLTKFQ